jgi:Protein of unknown function (DUF1592)/Protein of unknown function (DUF1588)/Protein of unknown function (DUF1585)/Protein of unknown function (DUF1587)/Planctomycete cytochrome C
MKLNYAIPLAFMLAPAALYGGPPKAIEQTCAGCHNGKTTMGGLDLGALPFNLAERSNRERWIRIHDRIEKGEMPPKGVDLPAARRAAMVRELGVAIHEADRAEVARHGRGPMRRLNRDEYEQNLRDVLQMPHLDIRDMLPEDREAYHFNKVSETLDMSRVQLTAYLDATEAALRQAMVDTTEPPAVTKFRAHGTRLFPGLRSTGGRESMFFIKGDKGINVESERAAAWSPEVEADPSIEMGLFRSPGWPYGAFPKGFAAKYPGEYRVRFQARAVLQQPGFLLTAARQAVPMTFRSRRPSNHDIAEDVKSTGGILEIQPQPRVYETTVLLAAGQTVEYGLLGLPVPQVDAIPSQPGSYRYPPFPPGGQPGVAFLWLEIEGPIAPPSWPPASHRVLFDDLGVAPLPKQPKEVARRLLRRFISLAARGPVPEEAAQKFERLVFARLDKNESFAEAMLAGYQAFLCSGLFLYLHEPQDHFAIADRLSHFLTNTRPDADLMRLAREGRLRDVRVLRNETERLIAGGGFDRFVNSFTGYWLNLRHLRRDDPDIRLYPEYRLDEYLVDSMERETRTFFTAMVRDNLPIRALVDADFVFVNDRLARHYELAPVSGSALRRVALPKDSPLGGLLTQGAILKVTANGTATSPVLRGAWIMDRIIGEPPPPPPPGVPAVEPDIRGAKTIRDVLAMHTKSNTCSSCHAKFDPVGLALENFDIFGRWRTRYRGVAEGERVKGIDHTGHDFSYTIAGAVDSSGKLADGRSFNDVREMKAIIAANPRQLARNLLHELAVYATGTPVRFSDRVEIDKLLEACAVDGYRTRDLLHALVQSRIFLGGY